MEMKEAIAEANRCLGCKSPKCKEGCPISNDIPEFIGALGHGDLGEARRILARTTNLPAICGRVCAREQQCEGSCVLKNKGKPIPIGLLERIVADFSFEMDLPLDKVPPKNQGKVAVIGSGPAGLTVAGDLAKLGFDVTVFEAQEEPGGILLYGIPSFRLSKKIVRREIARIEMLGVHFRTNCAIGRDITINGLFQTGFDAVFIGSGTAVPRDLDLPGRDLSGVIQAAQLLRQNYLHRSGKIVREEVPVKEGDRVLVVGGGNAAMDAARTAVRLGAGEVTVVYRRTPERMSAIPSEYEAAREEGVRFVFEAAPAAFCGEEGRFTALQATTPQGDMTLPGDRIFLALGAMPANRIVSTTYGIEVSPEGFVIIKDRPYGMTTRKGVFAAGDVVHGPASVVLAMKEAKRVAQGIAQYIDAVKLLSLP